MDTLQIKPQPKQELFLSSSADIAIYGGSAGGGKTWSILVEPLRHIDNPGFGAVIFRRSIAEVTKEGGLWDEANGLYPYLKAQPNQNEHQYTFPSGCRVAFGHLQYDSTVNDWKSSQIALIEFDQLETFTRRQFFYMMSRNRSTCGVHPYIRATCNPEPGWLADFLDWWIGDDGYALPERSGIIRWMVRQGDNIEWADTREELVERFAGSEPKSVTFILSTIFDNQILLDKDPNYLSNLKALDLVDQERLLGDKTRGGNWKIKPAAGKVFNKAWFEIVDAVPDGGIEVRFYDLAATEKKFAKDNPDFTASTKMKRVGNTYYVLDCFAEQLEPAQTDNFMSNTATQDGKGCRIRWEMEGGASGKRDSKSITILLAGYDAHGIRPQGDKLTRAKGLSAQSLAGNVKLLRGPWNERWLNHMHGQPELDHDDIMDSSSGAFNELLGISRTIQPRSGQG